MSSGIFPEKEVQLIINQERVADFENIPIGLVNNNTLTEPVKLLKTTEKTFVIRNSSGFKIEFNQDLIEGIIFR